MKHYLLFVTQIYSFSILRPLQKAIRDRGDDAAWYLHNIDKSYLLDDEKLLCSIDEVMTYKPVAVYVPTNWVPDFFPGVKVEIFHGLANDETGKKGHYRIRGLFDLYCTHGKTGTERFSALAKKYNYFHVTETGWPKLDPLFNNQTNTQQRKTTQKKPTIFYASTFSPSLSSAPFLLSTIKELSQNGDWHWLVTLHPKMDASLVSSFRALQNDNLDFIEANEDLVPVMRSADVMLCDTSSILLEFMLLDKPVVTFRSKAPGNHVIDIHEPGEVKHAIEQALTRPEALIEAARDYINQLHPYRDGKSSERVLEATDDFIQRHQRLLKKKPLNIIRKIKIRKWMNYYKW